jgi:hypothetical protein
MMRQYARIETAVVVEIVELADSAAIGDYFHPDLTFMEVTGTGAQVGWIVSGGSVAPPPPPPPPTISELTAYNGQARYNKETGGITVSLGFPIKTDDRAQAKINGMRLAAMNNEVQSTIWHAADGTLHTVDDAQIITMSNEMQLHIDNCFNISADCLGKISNGTYTTFAQIDAAYA